MPSFRFKVCLLLVIAHVALVAVIWRSLIIESISMRPQIPVTDGAALKWTRMEPPYMSAATGVQQVAVQLYYRGFGDTELRATAHGPIGGCFQDGFVLNGETHAFPVPPNKDGKLWCEEITLNLKPWLRPGRNTLEFTTVNTATDYTTVYSGISIGTPFFGADKTQRNLTLVMLASVLALVWLLVQKQGFAWPACLIFVLACVDYLLGLYAVPNFTYSMDLPRNLSFIQFVSENFWQTFDWKGPENWNPPLYYWMCALLARVLSWIGVFDMWTSIRAISLVSYCIMVYYGMRSMALYLKGFAFYLAFAVLAFWPEGMMCSAWLQSDLPCYAFYAASFYYLAEWYETGKESSFKWALANCGFAFMAKTSAVILLAIIGLTALFRLTIRNPVIRVDFTHIRGIPATIRSSWSGVRSLFTGETRAGWVTLAAGFLFNQTKYLYYMTKTDVSLRFTDSVSWGWGGEPMHPKDLVLFDVGSLFGVAGPPGYIQPIWSTLLTSMMFNLMHWPNREDSLYLYALLLIMLAYIFIFTITLSSERLKAVLPLLLGVVVPVTASVVYRYVCRTWSCMLFRYIEPSLIAIILIYMLSVQETRRTDKPVLYYGGNLVAILFILFSIMFFQVDGLDMRTLIK